MCGCCLCCCAICGGGLYLYSHGRGGYPPQEVHGCCHQCHGSRSYPQQVAPQANVQGRVSCPNCKQEYPRDNLQQGAPQASAQRRGSYPRQEDSRDSPKEEDHKDSLKEEGQGNSLLKNNEKQ